jgi:uncharacterized protein
VTAGTLTAGTAAQLASADWPAISADLDASGCAVTPRLLTGAQCRDLAGLYDQLELFRSTIDMGRHRFGSGQYRYFTHDLPETVRALREALYPHLLPIARSWAGRLGRPAPWPDVLGEWIRVCHQAGQSRSAQILRARAQSRGTSSVLPQGHGLIFTTRDRPVRTVRGWSAAPVRHGVSTVRSGRRHALGLVFHDA